MRLTDQNIIPRPGRRALIAALMASASPAFILASASTAHAEPSEAFALLETGTTSGSAALSKDAYVLKPIHLRPEDERAAAVYDEAASSDYISGQELARFGNSSAADMLRGQPGVQVGDSRNGGGLDVNIRGIQGQNRVAVTVDGTQQSLNVYRGYAGTQNRSYIDPDLISSVEINKGTTSDPGTASAIGGSVNMQTIVPEDILLPDRKFGIRIRGELQDNGIDPPHRPFHRLDPGKSRDMLAALPRKDRGNILNSDSKSGSIAAAFMGGNWDVLGAYATREQGNYFTGTDGHENYKRYYIDWQGNPQEEGSTAKNFLPGEEVLNTSSETESVLLKGRYRFSEDQKIALTYRYLDGKYGGIMPSSLYRWRPEDKGVQMPLSTVELHAMTLSYSYNPADNDLIDLSAKIWATDARTNQPSMAIGPDSLMLKYNSYWTPMDNTKIGVELTNESKFATHAGDFKLNLGASFLKENLEPQGWVTITQEDIDKRKVIRDGYRWEVNLTSRIEYQPNEKLTAWGGLNYTLGRTQDRNEATHIRAGVLTRYGEKISSRNDAISPSVGAKYEFVPGSFVYASYKEAVRTPSLFDTSMGTLQVVPVSDLKAERSHAFEIGISSTRYDLLGTGGTGAIRLAYFDNRIDDYITRFYDPELSERMYMRNADRFSVNGLELQSKFDNGRFFADLAITHYLDTETCDAGFAQHLRDIGERQPWRETQDTPDCTPGSFMGSYANTQNPPKNAVSLTLGARLLDKRLTLGSRVNYTSGPTERLDQPWHKGATTLQVEYKPVTVIDAFLNYDVSETAMFNASVSNITDRYYLDPLAQSYMPAPGRTVRAALTMKF
ncbi:TonB-dependent receptor domain-containing protein [Paracoccus aerodenitrificans]|uniref:TonB-dependent receptor domain-containing protein n=1 Tax=Paracoccus aerodenitrificans TaxID=3017781 RepID=UPI0022F05B67|nr:TonB-dependent receptor [Paracoccus aerodenitrificans]WBU65368.1 TonB-dependent receptor [Paracoccus aerodenitrificans]